MLTHDMRLKRLVRALAAITLAATGIGFTPARPLAGEEGAMPELPPLPAERWINTAPLRRADFAGRVVLIEIWTST